MRLRGLAILLVCALSLLAAACGGSDAGGGAEEPAGARITPSDTALFVSVNTDFEAGQWDGLRALAGKFPSSDRLVDELLSSLEQEGLDFDRDLQPALGPELDVALLDFPAEGEEPRLVGMTQPEDEARLRELLTRDDEDVVVETYRDWVIFSGSQEALDAFKSNLSGGALSEASDFGEAMDELDADALVRVWLDGQPLEAALAEAGADSAALEGLAGAGALAWAGMQAFAVDEGARLDFAARTEGGDEEMPEAYSSELVGEVPADSLVFVSFNDLANGLQQARNALGNADPELDRQIAQLESVLGLSVAEDVLPLFEGEGAIWVAPGSPIPSVGLVLTVDDEDAARDTLDRLGEAAALAAGGGAPTETEIAGEPAKQLAVGPVSVFWAVFDGKAVVSLGREGIETMREGGDGLDGNEVFEAAVEGAEMPDETNGFAFVNLRDGVPLLLGLAQLAGEPVDAEVQSNLEPLDSVLVYAALDGDVAEARAFVGVR